MPRTDQSRAGSLAEMEHLRQRLTAFETALTALEEVLREREKEWQRAEQAVRRNEAWMKSLIATTRDAFIATDRQGRIIQFNTAAEAIFGYRRTEIEGKPVTLLMPEPYATEHPGYIARYEQTHEPHAIGRIRSVAAKRKNGEIFPIELSVTEVNVDNEVHYGALIRDISDKVRLQEQLIERERLATIGTTLAKLSHEIGNPLNGMSVNAQLLKQWLAELGGKVDDPPSSYIHNIRQGIAHLSQLLQEFRSLSRRVQPHFEKISITTLIDEVLQAEVPHYLEQGVCVEQQYPPDLPPIVLDRRRMKQVILNLYKNAAEAMPEGGVITVRVRQAGEHVVCEIADTGIGIATTENIFDPFVTTKAEGTGLGLAVVKQIVAVHSGKITYTSQNGHGTTFTLTLPLTPPAAHLETE